MTERTYAPEILTPRLLLRPPRAGDFAAWKEFCADEETMEHLGGVEHEADAWRSFASFVGAWNLGADAMFSVIERSSDAWIGRIGPWCPHLWPVKEVGWGLRREYEGQAYALEAAVASIDYVFDVLGWETVSHLIADENTRSQALARRLGAAPVGEATMPGSLSKYQVTEWRQSRQNWVNRRAQFDALVPQAAGNPP